MGFWTMTCMSSRIRHAGARTPTSSLPVGAAVTTASATSGCEPGCPLPLSRSWAAIPGVAGDGGTEPRYCAQHERVEHYSLGRHGSDRRALYEAADLPWLSRLSGTCLLL